MHTSTDSPVHQLAESWFREERTPSPFQLTRLRRRLLIATLHQIRSRQRAGKSYNPFTDRIWQWATQYLNQIEDPQDKIDPNLHDLVSTIYFAPQPILSTKHQAANDHPEAD